MTKSNRDCYCALCRTPRVIRYSRELGWLHFGQLLLLTGSLTWLLFPWFEYKTLGAFFILWAAYDFTRKTLYRRELKCKVCGFDPTWYKRDVRVARRQVEDFLRENPDSPLLRVNSLTKAPTSSASLEKRS